MADAMSGSVESYNSLGSSISSIGAVSGQLNIKHSLQGILQTQNSLTGKVEPKNGLKGTARYAEGGTRDYEKLKNLPSIEEIELIKNHNLVDFGVRPITNLEIEEIMRH